MPLLSLAQVEVTARAAHHNNRNRCSQLDPFRAWYGVGVTQLLLLQGAVRLLASRRKSHPPTHTPIHLEETDRYLARLTKKKKERRHKYQSGIKEGTLLTDIMEITRITRECYEQLYANKLE